MSSKSSRESFCGDPQEKIEKRKLPEGDNEEKNEDEFIDELLKKASGGDPDALEQLVNLEAFYDRLKTICRAIARRYNADPEELLQELYKKIPSIIEDYKAQGRFLAWVSRVARNLQVDLLRRRNTQLKYDNAFWHRTEGAKDNTVEERYVAKIDLQRALSNLSAADRRLLELWDMGHTFETIARTLNMSQSAAYRRWRRLLQRLLPML